MSNVIFKVVQINIKHLLYIDFSLGCMKVKQVINDRI